MSILGTFFVVLVMAVLLLSAITQYVGASASASSPRHGKMTKVKGGKIHWTDEGSGPAIVMIHGLGGNLQNFTYALSSELSDAYRVIAIDRPGCGWSERDGPEQATLSEQARMIAEFIETEGLGAPLIVGHSLGGAIAETIALNHPEQVGALALICPATSEVKSVPDAFKGIDVSVPWLIPIIANVLAGAMAQRAEKKVFEEIFKPEPVAEGFLERGGGMLGRRPKAFTAAAQDLAQGRASVKGTVGREAELTMPVGVLFGAADNILDPQVHGKEFAEKASADYAELDGRGHMIPLTAPKDCAEFIRGMAGKTG